MEIKLGRYKGKVEEIKFIDKNEKDYFLVSNSNGICGYGGTEKFLKNKEKWLDAADEILEIENINDFE